MGMSSDRPIPISLTEAAIRRYGVVALADFIFLKHHTRSSGGIVYRSFTGQRAGKFRWGRSKFFATMSRMVELGLAHKHPVGWRLVTTKKVIGLHKGREVRHKCTAMLPRGCDEFYIRDVLRLKLMEMGWRQTDYYALSPEERFKAGRISAKVFCKQERVRLLSNRPAKNPIMGPVGSTPEEVLKFAQSGYLPMNTERLMEVTGLGRVPLFAWKRRAKERGWFDQVNRTFDFPPDMLPGLPVMYEVWQRQCRGKVSWGPVPRFHQAAVYKMKLEY